MDELPRSGYSFARDHQVNATAPDRPRSSVLASLALASAWVLAAFCALEVALPRAGRAAAGLLLRSDSAALRWLEREGASIQGFTAKGIFLAALATCATAALAALPARRPLRAAACAAVLAAACWVLARRTTSDVSELWWAALAGAAVAGAWILGSSRSASALGATALQGGVGAYAAWAIVIGTGSGALTALDRASEALVLGGVAVAGLAAWRPGSPRRSALAAAGFAAACAAAALKPEAAHAIVRHLVSAGNSGLPFPATTILIAAALAGIVVATGARGLAVPLLIALVCARRPGPWLIAGTLASSLLLLSRDWESRPSAKR
jgi:hypothetical protein